MSFDNYGVQPEIHCLDHSLTRRLQHNEILYVKRVHKKSLIQGKHSR